MSNGIEINSLKKKDIAGYFNNAPEWAQWLAKDRDGICYWFENQPKYNKRGNWKDVIPNGKVKFCGKTILNTGEYLWSRDGKMVQGESYGRA